jgi:hypothetical protein
VIHQLGLASNSSSIDRELQMHLLEIALVVQIQFIFAAFERRALVSRRQT